MGVLGGRGVGGMQDCPLPKPHFSQRFSKGISCLPHIIIGPLKSGTEMAEARCCMAVMCYRAKHGVGRGGRVSGYRGCNPLDKLTTALQRQSEGVGRETGGGSKGQSLDFKFNQ